MAGAARKDHIAFGKVVLSLQRNSRTRPREGAILRAFGFCSLDGRNRLDADPCLALHLCNHGFCRKDGSANSKTTPRRPSYGRVQQAVASYEIVLFEAPPRQVCERNHEPVPLNKTPITPDPTSAANLVALVRRVETRKNASQSKENAGQSRRTRKSRRMRMPCADAAPEWPEQPCRGRDHDDPRGHHPLSTAPNGSPAYPMPVRTAHRGKGLAGHAGRRDGGRPTCR